MTNKKWALLLIAVSIPISYYGFSNFEKGSSDPLEAILISLGCTGGMACFFGGLYMFFKGRGEILASQTSKDSPILDKAKIKQQNQKAVDEFAEKIRNETKKNYATSVANAQKEIINKKQKVNKMAKITNTSVDLMKREKELETRRKEVVAMLKEITKEQTAVVEKIKSKGWVQQESGEWGIE